ncbi:MAG: BolA/IbaG family iron-sulfur metabolism protein [Oligoflexia bacterium]|nr:BolA/IbaG family iron-sulfur metabolism protein [Oligoflexia bacterium]
MTDIEIQKRLQEKWPGTQVITEDLTGTKDHWSVTIISEAFNGKSMLDCHRMVKALFDQDIASGDVHALSIKTFTPDQWSKRS